MTANFVTAALLFATIPSLLFVIIYVAEMRYVRNTPAGRHLLGFTAIITLILLEELIRRTFREYISIEFHRVFLSITVIAAGIFLWQRLYSLLKFQVIPRRRIMKRRKRQAKNSAGEEESR